MRREVCSNIIQRRVRFALSLDMCVISPYLENLAPLRSQAGHYPGHKIRSFRCRLVWTPRRVKFGILVLFALVVYSLMSSLTLEELRTTTHVTHEWWIEKKQVDLSKVTGGSLLGLVLVSLWYCYIFSIREFVSSFSCALVYIWLFYIWELVFLVCKWRSPLLHFFYIDNLLELRCFPLCNEKKRGVPILCVLIISYMKKRASTLSLSIWTGLKSSIKHIWIARKWKRIKAILLEQEKHQVYIIVLPLRMVTIKNPLTKV